MQACNVSAGTITINVYAVPSGMNPDTTTLIYNQIAITASDTFIIDTERMVLGNGDAIYASAAYAATINFTTSSVGI